MIKTIYEVKVLHEDYFDHFRSCGPRPDVYQFDTLKEAWEFYSESRTHDYRWPNDHARTTSRIQKKFVFEVDLQPKHGYVRGYRRQYTHEIEFIERQYLNRPWFKKTYVCDPKWIAFYSQPAYMPNEVKCHRIKKEKPVQVVIPEYVFDFDDDDLEF